MSGFRPQGILSALSRTDRKDPDQSGGNVADKKQDERKLQLELDLEELEQQIDPISLCGCAKE